MCFKSKKKTYLESQNQLKISPLSSTISVFDFAENIHVDEKICWWKNMFMKKFVHEKICSWKNMLWKNILMKKHVYCHSFLVLIYYTKDSIPFFTAIFVKSRIFTSIIHIAFSCYFSYVSVGLVILLKVNLFNRWLSTISTLFIAIVSKLYLKKKFSNEFAFLQYWLNF